MGFKAVEWLLKQAKECMDPAAGDTIRINATSNESVALLGLWQRNHVFKPVSELR